MAYGCFDTSFWSGAFIVGWGMAVVAWRVYRIVDVERTGGFVTGALGSGRVSVDAHPSAKQGLPEPKPGVSQEKKKERIPQTHDLPGTAGWLGNASLLPPLVSPRLASLSFVHGDFPPPSRPATALACLPRAPWEIYQGFFFRSFFSPRPRLPPPPHRAKRRLLWLAGWRIHLLRNEIGVSPSVLLFPFF